MMEANVIYTCLSDEFIVFCLRKIGTMSVSVSVSCLWTDMYRNQAADLLICGHPAPPSEPQHTSDILMTNFATVKQTMQTLVKIYIQASCFFLLFLFASAALLMVVHQSSSILKSD